MLKALSNWVTTEKAILGRVMPRVRAIAALPGQSVAKLWQKGNRLLLLENTMSLLEPKKLKVTSRTPDPASLVPMLQAEYLFLGVTSLPAIWGC